MSDLLPDGWSLISCRELCHVITKGTTPSSLGFDFQDSGINFIKVESINSNGVIDSRKFAFISDEANLALKRSIICEGDILITIAGATVGKLAIALNVHLPANTNQALAIVRPNDKKVYGTYLHYWLQTDYIKKSIDAIKTVGAQPNLSLAQVGDFLVNHPPLPEQQKIAAILTSVDEVIEKTQAQIDKLKDLKTGMMQELLTKGIGHTEFKGSPVGRIPAEWEVKSVESILSVIIDYRGKAPPKSEIGVPLITAKNIRNGFINKEPREYIFAEQFDSWMVKGMPQYGDVFITTEAPLGNVAKVPDYKFAIGQRVLTLRPNEFMCTEFLLFILQSEKFKKELDLQSTGSTVAGIKQSSFRKVLLPIPSINEQIKISENLNSIVSRTDVIQDKLQHFQSLKKALMQDLLTGKVRVNTEKSNTEVAVG